MPSYYAHYRFARKSAEKFPDQLKEIVEKNLKYFDLGASGGDLLFFYKPYKKNEVRSYGSALHRENFIVQMNRFKEWATGSCHFERDVAFLAGYFTHFILDSAAHPYICKMAAEKVEKHFVIETDYERRLLIKDGLNPYSNKYVSHSADEDVREIATKYLNTSPKLLKKTIKDRKKFIGLISSQNKFTRSILSAAFKISGNPAGFDVLVQGKENPRCEAVREKLDAIYASALENMQKLSSEFYAFLKGEGELGERFDCNSYGCR